MKVAVEGITAISVVSLAILTLFQIAPNHDSTFFHVSKHLVNENSNKDRHVNSIPSMKHLPFNFSRKKTKFSVLPIYASADTVKGFSNFPSNERESKVVPNDQLMNSEKKSHAHGIEHPSFLSVGKNNKLVVLSDLNWKKKARSLRGHQQFFDFEESSDDEKYDTNKAQDYDLDEGLEAIHVNNVDFGFYPVYFDTFRGERLQIEMEYYKTHDKKWREQTILETFLYDMGMQNIEEEKLAMYHWFDESVHYCRWEGIKCGASYADGSLNTNVQAESITEIILPNFSLQGHIPTEISFFTNLRVLNLHGNKIHGSIPKHLAKLQHLLSLDLGDNQITGSIPHKMFSRLHRLQYLSLDSNQLIGTIPEQLFGLGNESDQVPRHLAFLDLSWNMFVGTIPSQIEDLCKSANLETLFLEGNMISGTIPNTMGNCISLRRFDIHSNQVKGTIPKELGALDNLNMLIISNNQVEGTIPSTLFKLKELQTFFLSDNQLSGTLTQSSWKHMTKLKNVALSKNQLRGKLPSLGGLQNIQYLDLHENSFTGSLPKDVVKLQTLQFLDLSSNNVTGSISKEFGEVKLLLSLNISNNRLTGTIPEGLCTNPMINNGNTKDHGCDAIACPSGYYSASGSATLNSKCSVCKVDNNNQSSGQDYLKEILGKTRCKMAPPIVPTYHQSNQNLPSGDVDGDGKISQREILRLLYLYTSMSETGNAWDGDSNSKWHKWKDLKVHECDLPGIVCKNGDVVSIQLREVDLCSKKSMDANANNKKNDGECFGLPTELGLLHYLEILNLSYSPDLSGNIPSEIGLLRHLKELNLSHSPNLAGSIPTEIGNVVSLTILNISDAGIKGTIPFEIGNLKQLERIDLSLNRFSGSIPESVGELKNLKEILISRSALNGTIPDSLGKLRNLENLELYGNNLEGSLPSSLGDCSFLMRIDVFNNKMTGTIPGYLARIPLLQIAHFKDNFFTGTLPSNFGSHPLLSWLDVSSNKLQGKIPTSIGASASLKELHLGGNRLQGPIPEALCTNKKINGGSTPQHSCDAILCPVGTYSPKSGYANKELPCQKCDEGETTLYLGGLECHKYTQRDYLKMFYDIMKGDQWENKFNKDWKDDGISECEWAGVSCDNDGQINGLSFPISASSLSHH